MSESSKDQPPSPYKQPSAAETRRKQLFLPLLLVPPAISTYFAYLSPRAQGPDWFALHPLMMMLGFFTLGGLSVLTKKMGGKANTEMHGNLMFASSALVAFGAYVIYSRKESMGKAHLTTPHAQLGALVLMAFLGYPILAYVMFDPTNGLLRTNQLARRMHRYSGRLTLLGGLVVCCMGILSMEQDVVRAGGMVLSLLSLTPFVLL